MLRKRLTASNEKWRNNSRLCRIILGAVASVALLSLLSASLVGMRDMRHASVQQIVTTSEEVAHIHAQHSRWAESMKKQAQQQQAQQQQAQQQQAQQAQQQQETDRGRQKTLRSRPSPSPSPAVGGSNAIERAFDEIFTTDKAVGEGAANAKEDTLDDDLKSSAAGFQAQLEQDVSYRESLAGAYVRLINLLARRNEGKKPIVAIASSISSSYVSLVVEVLPWIAYHTYLGVRVFYIMIDSRKPCESEAEAAKVNAEARETMAIFKMLKNVDVEILVSTAADSADTAEDDESITVDEHDLVRKYQKYYATHHQWKDQPGNYVLMIKQVR